MYLSELKIDVSHEVGRKWLANLYRVHQRLWMAFPDNERLEIDRDFLKPWEMPGTRNKDRERDKAGFLFRIERDGIPRILVQSIEKPNWDYAFQNAPYLLDRKRNKPPFKILSFNPKPQVGEVFRFRLLANVVNIKSIELPKMRTTKKGINIHKRRRSEILILPDPIPAILPNDHQARAELISKCWNPWRSWLRKISTEKGFEVIDEPSDRELRMQQVFTLVNMPSKEKGGPENRNIDIKKRFNAGLFEGMLKCTDDVKMREAIINGVGHSKAFGFGLLSIASVVQ